MYLLFSFYILFIIGFFALFEYSVYCGGSFKELIIYLSIMTVNICMCFFITYRFLFSHSTKFYYYLNFYWNTFFFFLNLVSIYLTSEYILNFIFQIIMNLFHIFYFISKEKYTYEEIQEINKDYPEATYL